MVSQLPCLLQLESVPGLRQHGLGPLLPEQGGAAAGFARTREAFRVRLNPIEQAGQRDVKFLGNLPHAFGFAYRITNRINAQVAGLG